MPADADFFCPCCERELIEEDDIERFQRAMKKLSREGSVLMEVDERTKTAKVSRSTGFSR